MTIPETYRDTIERFLAVYGEWLGYQLQAYNPAHDLAETGIHRQLAFIAQAAAGSLQHYSDDDEDLLEEQVLTDVADLVARLYYVPGIGTTDDVDVPAVFWEHPLGEMCARALLWALEGELITLQEAADLVGVTPQAVRGAIAAGRIAGYVDPDAPKRQKHTLVKRADVLAIEWRKWKTVASTNRYRKPAKRKAYEAVLKMLETEEDIDFAGYQRGRIIGESEGLSAFDARDVARKANAVVRHQRRTDLGEQADEP